MKINLGNLLRAFGVITREQLDAALAEQRRTPDRKLGEIIVSMGYAEAKAVEACLARQGRIASGSVDAREAAKLADYATHALVEQVGDVEVTGVFDVSEYRKA